MTHPDSSWRVGAIYRSCVRYGMTKDDAVSHLIKAFRGDGHTPEVRVMKAKQLAEIWFRNGRMDREIEEYREDQQS